MLSATRLLPHALGQSRLLAALPKALVLAPALTLVSLVMMYVVRRGLSETFMARVVGAVMLTLVALGALNAALVADAGVVHTELLQWYRFGHHAFELLLENNFTNATFALCFVSIIAVVGYFSVTYLHRERGYAEYCLLYLTFAGAVMLTVFSSNIDSLFVGWELVGLSSVLLIGFFRERPRPVHSSLYTLVSYRFGEVCLLTALVMAHVLAADHEFSAIAGLRDHAQSNMIVFLIVMATYVKSAQWPFCAWLPRAMEGPTPSSAIFYGGISTHLGPILLLKLTALFQGNVLIESLLIGGGLFTVFFASTMGRSKADIKSILAYATMAQLGLIFAELGFGWYNLAKVHCLVHCLTRTLQFLRSPSAFDDYRRLALQRHPFHIEQLYPRRLRRFLYYLTFSGLLLDRMIEYGLVRPFFYLCGRIHAFERVLAAESPLVDASQTQNGASQESIVVSSHK